ncbi:MULTISPECIES: hypothetical protein [unclassified Microbacterium]|uniref:hypothetical protein n=1 Tax=unclassified Microbacterium TaxID=2609290 RepID=UPI001603636A|nr:MULTISPECIES: hypothetical protein [unclassified Microbacterium]MBT2484812.1 hypothetical protein [Microbacterium sp. ISL-108]
MKSPEESGARAVQRYVDRVKGEHGFHPILIPTEVVAGLIAAAIRADRKKRQ